MRSRRGFTLIEVVIVMVILAILAAIAMPSIATQNDLNASAASRVVLGDLLYAQGQAIATGQYVWVSFTVASSNPGGGSGSYSLTYQNGAPFPNPITQVQSYSQAFGLGADGPLANAELDGVTLDNGANTVLVFNELGQPLVCSVNGPTAPLANTGTIVLQSGLSTVTVSIEPNTGNITVSSNN